MSMNPNRKSFNLGGEWIGWQKYLDQAASEKWSDFDWQKEFGLSRDDAIILANDILVDLLENLENTFSRDSYDVSRDMRDMYRIFIRKYEPSKVESYSAVTIRYGVVNTYPVYKVEYLTTAEEEYYDFTTMSSEEIANEIFSYVQKCSVSAALIE